MGRKPRETSPGAAAAGTEDPSPAARPTAVTSYDVARVARVSQSSVSRVFTPGASVSPEVRRRVLRAANQLGYQPNAIARSLITRRSGFVGLLIGTSTNLYYPEVLSELSRSISDAGSRVLLFTVDSESGTETVLTQLWRYQVDGVIAATRLDAGQLAEFAARKVPVVFYNRVPPDNPATAVTVDHAEGERRLIDRLVAAGHRRFGIVGGPADNTVSLERTESAIARLRHHGIDAVATVRGDYGYQSGVDAFHALRREAGEVPQAVVCANDAMALGVMDAARLQAGLRIPQDLSVVGFDGAEPSRWLSYGLTTIRQPVRRMAEAAVAMLVERIARPDIEPERRLYAGELVEGASARLGKG